MTFGDEGVPEEPRKGGPLPLRRREEGEGWSGRDGNLCVPQETPAAMGAAARFPMRAGAAPLCLTPGWYGAGASLLRIREKGPTGATMGTDRRQGAGKVPRLCRFTLPEPRARPGPAALAEEEEEAHASAADPVTPPPPIPPSHGSWSRKLVCQQFPCPEDGAFSWQETQNC